MSFIDELLEHARWEARAMRNDKIDICHIFCALTKFPESMTCAALDQQGFDPIMVRRQVRGLIGRPDFWIAPKSIQHDAVVKLLFDKVNSMAEKENRDICESDIVYALLSPANHTLLFNKLEIMEIDPESIIGAVCGSSYTMLSGNEHETTSLIEHAGELLEPVMGQEELEQRIRDLECAYSALSCILTLNPQMMLLKSELANLARYKTDVLLIGETGTGKELFASAIHQISGCSGPLIPINCGAIPKDLFESELFGHKKGAFSGAISDKKGAFELANFGTLFLDEIGELPIDLQSKLLRAIEYREIRPLGSHQNKKLELKILFATNRDLKSEVDARNFREDLYFRISSPCLRIPPLRGRSDDIHLLFNHFLEQASEKFGKNIKRASIRVLSAIRQYKWPGNVRELKKVVEEGVMKARGDELDFLPIPLILDRKPSSQSPQLAKSSGKEKFSDSQLLHWVKALDGNKTLVAEKLGVSYRTVLRRCKKLDL